jgi:nucleoside-diphosphate-sugar epimerase
MSLILMTGSTGFLGSAIRSFFILQQYVIITVGRQLDNDIICDLSQCSPLINTNEIEGIIHVAGKAHTNPKSELEKKIYFDVNLTGTQNLLNGLENLTKKPKWFVFISSVAVYGIEQGNEINEDFPLHSIDPYGLSKIQAESIVYKWCQKNNVVCTILRLPLLVGVNPPGNLGSMIKAINHGYYFNINGGKAKKSMVLAEDVSRFIPKVTAVGGIYNLTDGNHPTLEELGKAISQRKIFNLPLFTAKLLGLFGDFFGDSVPINSKKIKKLISNLTFDDSKARKVGWESQSVLEYYKKLRS